MFTSVCGVERGEGDHKESCRVFSSVHQVRKSSLGVTVTPQALDEAEPGGQTLDDGAQTVRVAVAYVVTGVWSGRNEKRIYRMCMTVLSSPLRTPVLFTRSSV